MTAEADRVEAVIALEERLRKYRPTDEWGDGVRHVICDDAADLIEALRTRAEQAEAEVERLSALWNDARSPRPNRSDAGGYG